MNIIEELKQFKEENKISMYTIAKDLDLPYQTVYYWFTKGKRPFAPYKRMIQKYIETKYVKRND